MTDNDPHVLAVVGILFQVSEEDNPAFDAILNENTLKKIEFPDDLATENITGYDIIDNLDLSYLIPDNLETAGYYAYEGSLTTPPCTDVVRWHMMKATSTISEQQLEKLRVLMNDEKDPIAPNFRPIQENINGVWDCSSANLKSAKYIDLSHSVDTNIESHGTLNIISVINILLFCCIIFTGCILISCWCFKCQQLRHQNSTVIKNAKDLESDALIHKV